MTEQQRGSGASIILALLGLGVIILAAFTIEWLGVIGLVLWAIAITVRDR